MPKRPLGHTADGGKRREIPFRERVTCSITDAEAASGISRSQLYLEMKSGRLEFIKRGTRRLVVVPSLLKMLGA